MNHIAGLAHAFAVFLSPVVLPAWVLGLGTGMALAFLPGISPVGALVLATGFLGPLILSFGAQSFIAFTVASAYSALYGRALAAINQNAGDA